MIWDARTPKIKEKKRKYQPEEPKRYMREHFKNI